MEVRKYENITIIVVLGILASVALFFGRNDVVSVIVGALGGYLGAKHTTEKTQQYTETEQPTIE